jgi:hypothetical protein
VSAARESRRHQAWRTAKKILRGARPALIFLAALLGSGALIRQRLPFPPVPSVAVKVGWLRAHGDEYDTFFVGSSRTRRHVIPELFDELMAAGGHPTRSFNFGFDGMRPPEDSYALEAALARRRAPLKFVLVEGNDLRVNLDAEARGTMRAAYWHDLKRCAVVARATLWATSSDEHTWFGIWSDRFANIGTFFGHVQPALSRAVNLGRGPERWTGAALETAFLDDLGARRDGFESGENPRAIRPANLAKLKKGVAARLRQPAQPFFSDAESQRVLQEKRRFAAAHGGRLIVFHPPLLQPEIFYPDPRFGPAIPVIDLGDPGKFPVLFDPQLRKDESHLNPAGAKIFTQILVDHLLKVLSTPAGAGAHRREDARSGAGRE